LTSAASEHPIDQLASNVEKIDLGQGSLRETVIHGLRRLSGLGLDRQLLEAGPTILGAASELIDELCLTVTDVDSEFDAEAAVRLRRQLPFLSQNMQLQAIEIIGDTAFTRWR
jgi:riboflavin biosynthesis pyrimidine reductase